jgi:chromosomal replication initiation ATPase DnaA
MEEPIVPQALQQALDHQRGTVPDDGAALDRLFNYLNVTRPSMAEIRASVCEFYAIEPLELRGRFRQYETAMARQIFCYLAYRHTRFHSHAPRPHR